MNKAADRFYGSIPGGLFNLPHTPDMEAERTLHDALLKDGRFLPPAHRSRLSSFDSIVNRGTIKEALWGMALGSVAGVDGFPTEFFSLFALRPHAGSSAGDNTAGDDTDDEEPEIAEAHRVIDLLVEVYRECLSNGTLPPHLNISITTRLVLT